MAFNFQGGTVNVSGSVSAIESFIQITSAVNGQQAGTGTTTMGTVPANKRWKIAYIEHSVINTASAGNSQVHLNDVCYSRLLPLGTATGALCPSSNIVFTSACPILTAGQTIKLIVSAGSSATATATVGYIEEAV